MRFKPLYFVLVLVFVAALSDSKRSRGRSRGSSSSSSGFWNRKQKHSPEVKKPVDAPKPVPAPAPAKPKVAPAPQPAPAKPSAPAQETPLRKETSNLQQSSAPNSNLQHGSAPNSNLQANNGPNSGRPIGWNVDSPASQGNVGFKTGHQPGSQHIQQQHVNPSNAYPSQQGLYPNSGSYGSAYPSSGGYGNNGGYGNAYPSNNGYGGGYNTGYNTGYGGYQNSYNPQQPFPGYHPTSNIGVIPPRGANAGHYYNSVSGYGNNPMIVPQQQSGLLGSMFGGNKNHYGGYGGGYGGYGGGYGGYGGYGGGYGGYGMKKSGGFFGKNAFRNVLAGVFIWHIVSGLTRRPYHVYNYYNQPPEQREEIKLPANILTLCDENATSLCIPGTIAICTTNNTILCATSYTAAAPCKDNNREVCVNSKINCIDANDPLCQNKTSSDNTTMITVPCFTNMTIDKTNFQLGSNITLPSSDNGMFCVTTMAVPDDTIESTTPNIVQPQQLPQFPVKVVEPSTPEPDLKSTSPSSDSTKTESTSQVAT